jgi:glycosyltransferase involved in cell wall biosynthesis
MKVLLLSSRFPWPPFTGDRIRATVWLSALEREHEVALVSPAGLVASDAPRFRFHPASVSLLRGARGALRTLAGDPLQSLPASRYDWPDAIHRARRDLGGIDVTIVLLSRLDPVVRALLPNGAHILDAVDSLRRSMAERSREGSLLLRALWRMESQRIGRVEQEAARVYDRVLVVSPDEEARELGALTISNGVAIAPLVEAPRRFDFAYWGRLAYFANADAVQWLLREIWPAVRALRPDATLLIAGADAPDRVVAAHGRDGIFVQSPVDDMAALARQVKVALFPVRYGTGQATKVLEAAEAGCALVATSKALRGLAPLAAHAAVAEDVEALARSAVSLLDDEARRVTMGARLRATVEENYSRQRTLERLAGVVRGL